MTNNDQIKPKSEYIRLRDGLAIRKVPQSKNWNLYLNLPGHKRLQFSLKTPDEDKAIELAWAEYTYAKAMLHNGEPLRQPTQRLTLVQVLDEIIKEHEKAQSKTKVKGKDGAHATHIRIWKRFVEFYDPKLKPSQLDVSQVRAFLKSAEPFSDTQLTATRYCFTTLFDRCVEKQLIKKDQVADLKKIKVDRKETKRRDHFTYAEFSTLYVSASVDASKGNSKKTIHSRHMGLTYMCFIFFSGVRAGEEALGIKWSDLSYNKHGDLYCVIREGKTRSYRKNNRFVLLDYFAEGAVIQAAHNKNKGKFKDYTNQAIINHLSSSSPNEPVFSTLYSDKPTYPVMFKRWLTRAQEAGEIAEGKELSLYSLRHSYITRAIEDDVQLSLIAENAGTSVAMIEKHYSHVCVMSQTARKALMRDKIALLEKMGQKPEQKEEDLQAQKEELLDFVAKEFPI
ncbi:tyrosine-type recombinase/integrase [Vibrio harveyi]|uniref:tyrosine-type recombinase/integrase n=1 Tax=Vibrio harveyi TaxID=669 RepID=UPI000317F1B6|nr:site-specific integrase [Vibrio harveyi]